MSKIDKIRKWYRISEMVSSKLTEFSCKNEEVRWRKMATELQEQRQDYFKTYILRFPELEFKRKKLSAECAIAESESAGSDSCHDSTNEMQ